MKQKTISERGQALIVMALAAIGLFAIVGLAIDGSAKFSDRRHAQNAADSAALAAALEKVNALTAKVSDNSPTTNAPTTCPPPSGVLPSPVCEALQLAGLNRALSNGYNNNLVSNTVEVYSPPISGPYAGNNKYVQVIILSHVNTTFARVVGIQKTHNTVQAVALTAKGGPLFDGAAFISLNPSPNCGNGSVYVGGSGTINLNGGSIFVNSNVGCGFSMPNCTGFTLNLNGGGVMSAGSPISSCDPNLPKDTTQEQFIIPDDVYMPPEPDECGHLATAYQTGPNEWHITPGYYSDFPQSNINGDIVGIKKDIIMDPGVYCVGKSIKWSGNTFTSLDGSSGVTIYIKSGNNFSLSIDSPITLNASNSPGYEGYLIILDGNRNNIKDCTINGGSYILLNGTIFAPYCNITINGDNKTDSIINAQIVGWDLKLNGGSTINIKYDPAFNAKNKRKVGLMR
jgi:Tfp pilus assembly protein PilX